MLDRWRHQPDHPRRGGPQTGGRGLVQVRHLERARRGHARLQHLRHRCCIVATGIDGRTFLEKMGHLNGLEDSW